VYSIENSYLFKPTLKMKYTSHSGKGKSSKYQDMVLLSWNLNLEVFLYLHSFKVPMRVILTYLIDKICKINQINCMQKTKLPIMGDLNSLERALIITYTFFLVQNELDFKNVITNCKIQRAWLLPWFMQVIFYLFKICMNNEFTANPNHNYKYKWSIINYHINTKLENNNISRATVK
jgi:hypothetical protein